VSWRVAIRHRTAYVYAGDVRSSYNEARVTPLTTDRQLVVEAEVRVAPAAPTLRYWDYWGTMVDAFDVHEAHTELSVTGSSVVETSEPKPPGELGWDGLAGDEVWDRMAELLAPTELVPHLDEVAAGARSLRTCASPAEACDQAVDWVRERLRYEKGVTDVSTTAGEALRLGAGVCQDYAHLALSLLRSAGIPARYVSGYIFPSRQAEVGMDVAGQSHAWVEAWTGDWYAVDPTHDIPVGERHVVVARGRDYGDVPPLRGIYHGGPAEALVVSVELTRLA
jgi:transglutaminase-like putative cysteine protease